MRSLHPFLTLAVLASGAPGLAPAQSARSGGGSATGEAAQPALPREFQPPAAFPVTRVVPIAAGDVAALRNALATARAGDEIRLAAGDYRGWWVVGAHAGTGYVTVRGPTSGPRARLLTTGRNEPCLRVNPGAAEWRFVGLEFGATPNVQPLALNTCVFIGAKDGQTTSATVNPRDLVFDSIAVLAHDSLDLTRCMLLNGNRIAVRASRFVCHGVSTDAMALGAWTAAAQVLLEGNSIAGSGHGVIVGGNDPADSTLLPRDWVVRANRFYKPATWQKRWGSKTLLEFKLMRRALIEGNVFEDHWIAAQSGFAVLLKSVNQSGTAPWSVTEDVTIRLNILRRLPAGFNLAARPEPNPAIPARRVAIVNNLLYDVGEAYGTRQGTLAMLSGPLADVRIERNTWLHNAGGVNALFFENTSTKGERLLLAGNLMTTAGNGWNSPDGFGVAALRHLFGDSWRATGNVMGGAIARPDYFPYPPGTAIAATVAELGFANAASGDFSLTGKSSFARRGVGADIDSVMAATAAARALR